MALPGFGGVKITLSWQGYLCIFQFEIIKWGKESKSFLWYLDQKIKIYLQNWWKPEVLGEKPSNLQKNYIESSTIMTFFMIQNL